MQHYAEGFFLFGLFALFCWWHYRTIKNGKWHDHFKLRSVTCIDGVRRSGELMRRWVNGAWQYRELTDEEAGEAIGLKDW